MSDLLVILPPGALKNIPLDSQLPISWCDGERQWHGTLETLASEHRHGSCAIVLSCADALLSRVTLAKKQARHIARVIPFLMEEQLSSSPDGQWFSWAAKSKDNYFPVNAVEKQALETLLSTFKSAGLDVDSVRIDGQMLSDLSPGVLELSSSTLLLTEATALCIASKELETTFMLLGLEADNYQPLEGDYLTLLWRAHESKQGVELLHDQLRPKRQKSGTKPSGFVASEWRPLMAVCASLILIAWIVVLVQSVIYQNAAQQVSADARNLYKTIYPGEKIVRFKAQFEQKLKQAGAGGSEDTFLTLMSMSGDALAKLKQDGVSAKRIKFDSRSNGLVIELHSPNFELIEKLEARLKEQGLNVEIANLSNQGEKVKASMKVTS